MLDRIPIIRQVPIMPRFHICQSYRHYRHLIGFRFSIYQDFTCIRNLNMLVSQGILKGLLIYLGFWICQSFESVLETTLKKYQRETLKNKIYLECIWPETWILFLALNNIHFLRVLEKSFRNNAPPMILSNPPSWCFPNITNGTPFSRPPMPPTLAHRSLYPFWRTTHVGTSP